MLTTWAAQNLMDSETPPTVLTSAVFQMFEMYNAKEAVHPSIRPFKHTAAKILKAQVSYTVQKITDGQIAQY